MQSRESQQTTLVRIVSGQYDVGSVELLRSAKMLLENDSFLSELTRLFQKSKTSGTGSLMLTMKRYDGRTKPKPRNANKALPEPSEYKCLMRACLGKKTISTIVNQKDVNKFQLAYANVIKGNIDGLKKKEKKSAKSKAKAI